MAPKGTVVGRKKCACRHSYNALARAEPFPKLPVNHKPMHRLPLQLEARALSKLRDEQRDISMN